jgi:hypothetical protein
LGLLALFVLLGLAPIGSRKAIQVAVCVTALVITAVFARTSAGM